MKITAKVTGMTCEHCVLTVQKAVRSVQGVIDIKIDNWRSGSTVIEAGETVSPAVIQDAVSKRGYGIGEFEERKIDEPVTGFGQWDYDLIIIGGGSAAFSAALKASEMDKTVLMINDGLPIGGTCVNVGCVPSKTLIRTAESLHIANHPNFSGIKPGDNQIDFREVIRQKRDLVADLRQKKYLDVIGDDQNIQIIEGRGKLLDKNSVEVNGETKTAKIILIATGSSTFIPEIPGLKDAPFYTNDTLYELEELPEHLIILGGRYIALENAQMFARFGSKVTVLQRSTRILPTETSDLTDRLTIYLREEGIDIKTGVKVKRVESYGKQVAVETFVGDSEEIIEGTHLFVATGRKGNSADLGLEAIGIELHGNGFVKTDEYQRTSVKNIYAAGDITGEHLFVYTAAYAGALCVENAFTTEKQAKDYSVLPWVIFSDPQVAGVGMDETQAEVAGISFDISVLELKDVPRSLAARNTKGFIKLIRNKETDQLIGARILASEGSELLMEIALAIRFGITVKELKRMFHPYLTLSEGIKLTAISFDKDVAKLSCCAV